MKRFGLTFIFLLTSACAIARIVDPGFPGEDPDVPIDGGVSLLLIAGAVYGVRKIRKMQQ